MCGAWAFPKIGGKPKTPPKWMVFIMEKHDFSMDDFWGKPTIFGKIHISLSQKKRRQSLFFPLLAPHSRPGESFVGLMRKERKHHQLP